MGVATGPEARIRALGHSHGEPVRGPRERVLAEAFVLFYANGIRAVGVDLLVARSGVAKASFYRHFPSEGGGRAAACQRAAAGREGQEPVLTSGRYYPGLIPWARN